MPPIDDNNAPVLSETAQDIADFVAAAEADGTDDQAPASGAADADPDPATLKDPATDGSTVGDDPPAQATPAPTDQTATANDDPWTNAPPELRQHYQELNTQLARTKGQLSAADRELHSLRNQPKPNAETPKAKADVKTLLGSEQISELRSEYGDVANPLLTIIEGMAAELEAIKGNVAHVETDREEAFLSDQLDSYAKDHPDWAEYAKAPQEFANWIATQPRHVREAAARNSEFIVDAAEASDVLSRFKSSIGVSTTVTQPQPPQLDPKRARQLAGARNVQASSPPVASGEPDDPDALFANAAAKVDKERGVNRL